MGTRAARIGLAVALLAAASTRADSAHFADFVDPVATGDRTATVMVDYLGVDPAKMEVFVVYATDRATVSNAFVTRLRTAREPSGVAKCRAESDGRYRCSFIFPHADARKPNRDDANATVFGSGTHVFYAWAKSFVPKGATETLTINSEIREFDMPRKVVIGGLGDSYGAGQGAPNRKLVRTLQNGNGLGDKGDGMWNDVVCHRSDNSGQALAVKQLIDDFPGIAFDFKHVACSGATVGAGLIGNQDIKDDFWTDPAGRIPAGNKPPQVMQIFDWAEREKHKAIDVLVISIGGNDTGFGSVATSCLLDLVGECAGDARATVAQAFAILPQNYQALDDVLHTEAQRRNVGLGTVMLTEYPDLVHGSDGLLCSPGDITGKGGCWGPLEATVSTKDFEFIDENFQKPLNDAVRAATERFNWTYVGGVADASRRHGLCNCAHSYHNTPGQSDHDQGDLTGTAHPNAAGYDNAYRPAIYKALRDWVNGPQRRATDREVFLKLAQFRASGAKVLQSPVAALQNALRNRPRKPLPPPSK